MYSDGKVWYWDYVGQDNNNHEAAIVFSIVLSQEP